MNPAREAALSDPAMAAAPTIDLAGLLAAFHADALTRLLLLLLRTDLADPPPRYLAELAHRAGAISSQAVCRAQLDEFTLQFLDAAIIGGLADRTPTAGDPPTDRLDAALNRLVARGLLDTTAGLRVPTETASWSAPARLGPPSAVRRAGRPSPNADLTRMCRDAGLLKPPTRKTQLLDALAQRLGDPATVQRLVVTGPTGTAELAESVASDGPLLSAPSWAYHRPTRTPANWLEHCALIVSVRLDQPAGAPRGGHRAARRAAVWGRPPRPAAVDGAPGRHRPGGRGRRRSRFRLVGDVNDLCAAWEKAPARELAGGVLGSRELRRTAKLLRRDGRAPLDESEVARIAELAAAGLI
jgi:hypothetical protein